ILAGDKPALAQMPPRRNPAARRAGALHDDGPRPRRLDKRLALIGARAPRRETGRDEPPRSRRDRRSHQVAIRPRIGIEDVDARQIGELASGEWRLRHVRLQRRTIEMRSVAIDMAERAK